MSDEPQFNWGSRRNTLALLAMAAFPLTAWTSGGEWALLVDTAPTIAGMHSLHLRKIGTTAVPKRPYGTRTTPDGFTADIEQSDLKLGFGEMAPVFTVAAPALFVTLVVFDPSPVAVWWRVADVEWWIERSESLFIKVLMSCFFTLASVGVRQAFTDNNRPAVRVQLRGRVLQVGDDEIVLTGTRPVFTEDATLVVDGHRITGVRPHLEWLADQLETVEARGDQSMIPEPLRELDTEPRT